MKTVIEVLQLSSDFLKQKGIHSSRREVEDLLSHVLNCARIDLYLQFDRPLEHAELDQFRLLIKKRAQRMPYQYIIGEIKFLGCAFEVTPEVLIPRPETEILADRVVKELSSAPAVIWDLCCGSGCLGVSIKKKRPDCSVFLSDLSLQATHIARRNAERNGADVEVRQGDLTAAFESLKVDVVVCNPPYVSEHEYVALEPEVQQWEPKMALVGGVTGYEFYYRLSQELLLHLKPMGTAYFEIGSGMGAHLKTVFLRDGWSSIEISSDWGSHERFVKAMF